MSLRLKETPIWTFKCYIQLVHRSTIQLYQRFQTTPYIHDFYFSYAQKVLILNDNLIFFRFSRKF